MTTQQYIGARYVPIFGRKGEESIEWDNSKSYEPLTVVLHEGNSYTSRQFVPVGVDIKNEDFWALTGNYNAQIELYRSETTEAKSLAENALSTANEHTNYFHNLDIDSNADALELKTHIDDVYDRTRGVIAVYNSVQDMVENCTFTSGYVKTLNFDISDNGGCIYHLTASKDNDYSVKIGNVWANPVILNSMRPEQLVGTAEDYTGVFNFLFDNVKTIMLTPNKVYKCGTITSTWNDVSGNMFDGNNAIIECDDFIINHSKIVAHDFKGAIYQNFTVKTSNGTGITVENAIKTSFRNIRINGDFTIGIDIKSGYEQLYDNINVFQTAYNDSIGLNITCTDSTFYNIYGFNCSTFIKVNSGSCNFFNLHGWINPNDYDKLLEDSTFINYNTQNNQAGVNIDGIYFDSYQYAITINTDVSGLNISNVYWYVNPNDISKQTDFYFFNNTNSHKTNKICINNGIISYNEKFNLVNGTFSGIFNIFDNHNTKTTNHKKCKYNILQTVNSDISEIISQNNYISYDGILHINAIIKYINNTTSKRIDIAKCANVFPAEIESYFTGISCTDRYFNSTQIPTSYVANGKNGILSVINVLNDTDTYYLSVNCTFPVNTMDMSLITN